VSTWEGTVYAAFTIDVFSRKVVGWTTSMSKETGLVLDTIEMGLHARDYREQGGKTNSFIIPMLVVSIRLFGSLSIWSILVSMPRSAPSVTPLTALSRNH
jgi:transposase InsO family protein